MTDDHLPADGLTCEVCGENDHVWCMDTDLDIRWVGPQITLHDAALAVCSQRQVDR